MSVHCMDAADASGRRDPGAASPPGTWRPGKVILGIRPEHIAFCPRARAPPAITGKVDVSPR